LRFAEFLNSKIVNGRIEEALQLGDNRIVRVLVRQGDANQRFARFYLYIRLWSNAANVIVTDEDGTILDAMKRLPKKGEIESLPGFPHGLPPDASFNQKIDIFYSQQGGSLSLEALREEARRNYEGRIGRLKASLERLMAKEAEFSAADKLREYGDIILANLGDPHQAGQPQESRGGGGRVLCTVPQGKKRPSGDPC